MPTMHTTTGRLVVPMDRRQMDSEGCIDPESGPAPSCNAEAVAGGQSSHGDASSCVRLECCSMRITGILEWFSTGFVQLA